MDGAPPLVNSQTNMINPLLEKLGTSVNEEERELLVRLTRKSVPVEARQEVVRDREGAPALHVLMAGMACRYKMMPGGRRAITGYVLPGDLCDLTRALTGNSGHCVVTLVPSIVAEIAPSAVTDLMTRPGILRAMLQFAVAEKACLREWLANMGQELSEKRLAHLLCEFHHRFAAAGLARHGEFQLPLTQEELGESLGISAVHVNRVMQKLKNEDLIRARGRVMLIPDVGRLEHFAEFDPGYLQVRLKSMTETPAS
jgi:CRP-like cAMP-binding protein